MNNRPPNIDGFQTIRSLGKGGMSEVYEAENLRLGSRQAVKIFAYKNDDPDVRARFEQEGRLLAKLRHPRIVAVNEIGTLADGRRYFVMDLILNPDGKPQTLADVPDGGADEETIARWYDDIREGLDYIHSKGIVHRDLKLQNVMVGPDGHAVLTDFGISRVISRKDGVGQHDAFETNASTGDVIANPVNTLLQVRDGKRPLMGSVGYMSPELELGCAATPQSDWYALGVIVYRLLTGSWCDARTDLAGSLEGFDPTWMQIIPNLLHANPAGRSCPSFAEIRATLQTAKALAEEELREHLQATNERLRIATRTSITVIALLAGALTYETFIHRNELHTWRHRARLAQMQVDSPLFDELFKIPAAAKAEDSTDENGEELPSRSAFAASRIDALVLTRPLFLDLASGRITPEDAIRKLEGWADDLENDSAGSPLDELEFGDSTYLQMGDNASLHYLLTRAAEKLRARSEE